MNVTSNNAHIQKPLECRKTLRGTGGNNFLIYVLRWCQIAHKTSNSMNYEKQFELRLAEGNQNQERHIRKKKLGKLRFLLIKKNKLIGYLRKRVLKIINESGVITMLEKNGGL